MPRINCIYHRCSLCGIYCTLLVLPRVFGSAPVCAVGRTTSSELVHMCISLRPSTQKAVHLRGGLTYYQKHLVSSENKDPPHAPREGPRRCHVAALAGAAASMAPPLLRCGSLWAVCACMRSAAAILCVLESTAGACLMCSSGSPSAAASSVEQTEACVALESNSCAAVCVQVRFVMTSTGGRCRFEQHFDA